MVLLGRSSECAALDDVMAAAHRGDSRALVLLGEAGVGKTALLDYLMTRSADCRTVRLAGIQSEAELSFAALHQLCASMLDRLGRLPEPQRHALETAFGIRPGPTPDRLLVGLAVLSLLAETAAEQPLVCVVDDAHWLDRASAQALTFAARRLVAESVVLVFARRTTEPAPDLGSLPTLEVGGLDYDDARDLLQQTLPVVLDEQVRDRIVAETHGNPLAILELPRGLTQAELASGLFLPASRGFTDQLEASFGRRATSLPPDTQRLLLVAAAESIGDAGVVRRAARQLGIGPDAALPGVEAGLWTFGGAIRFRHPLVRSAVYRGASPSERQIVHGALARQTRDLDRRTWHRALAAATPDEELAADLERSGGHAQERGGYGQAAAFLQIAARMTPDAGERARRQLGAARAECLAGDLDAALAALGEAEAGPLDDIGRMHAHLISAQVAFAADRGGDAALLLLRAAKEAEPLDPSLARETYLQAMMAATWAGRLPEGVELRDFAEAAHAAASPPEGRGPADYFLDGLALFVTEDYESAARVLRDAMNEYRSAGDPDALGLPMLAIAFYVAHLLWDDEAWLRLSDRYLDRVRSLGALSALPMALDYRVFALVRAGELSAASALVEETVAIAEAIEHRSTPYGAMALSAWQGRRIEAEELIRSSIAAGEAAGVGLATAIAHWTSAILHNGLGKYDEALSAATQAAGYFDLSDTGLMALIEQIEAASHTGHTAVAAEALRALSARTQVADTDWARGTEARCRALVSTGAEAEACFREAIQRLGRTVHRPDLARAHLLYGEWLRRERRRLHARDHLRTAYEMFSGMGMEAFADRAARELRATGAATRKRTVGGGADLTAQETQVSRLAREGLSNSEIATRLFLSPKTVEYHLHKVFAKLNVTSRKDLRSALGETL